MSKGSLVGFSLLIGGILIWIIYGFYLGWEEIMQALDLVTGFVIGLIVIGIIVLFGSILIEQRKDTKKMREEIKKEDLEP
jgi:low affinity Fe/Cu permease